ncbi:threonine ammonia-lyase IlvA [Marmoricola endophyticus]|nr:threonine ammonia-lyase IlvA [Marmoricola endophyticus]
MSDLPVTPDDVARAAEVVPRIAVPTALDRSSRLSERHGVEVLLKREDQQVGRSYKVRGAFNLMSGLTPDELARGVVCASAGNHAQGLALSCSRLGVDGHIFVPTNTPRQKRDRIRELGGDRVTLTMLGKTYDEASTAATAHGVEHQMTYVHPFDDPRTVAGQGTVAFGLVRDEGEPLDVAVVPVGGGGLLAGMATWLKHRWPDCRVIGVEPEGAASMRAALAAGEPVALEGIDTFVDGASVGRVGATTYPIVRDLVDDVVTVSTGAVSTEMLALYQSDGIIAEPAGAMASAALSVLELERGSRVGCVVSGGNNDVSRYADVIERSLVHEGLRHYFLVSFPQEPGALRHFLDDVLAAGEDIVVFEYVKKSNRETGPALIGIDLESADGLPGLMDRMKQSNINVEKIASASPLFEFVT